MFPNASFLGMDMYYWMIVIGVLVAIVTFRLCYKRAGMSDSVYNFALIVCVAGVIFGYLSAVLFQSWYSYLDTGVWKWGVGATFYGGLIGAAVVVLALYFGIGHFVFKDKLHIREFNNMLSLVMPCIIVAHGFGRLGCLFEGCCYGAVTDSAIGIKMYTDGVWETRVPIQLFEMLFLFSLFAVLIILLLKYKFAYTASAYFIAYGVWRFVIEYFRDDARGASGIGALSPSQLTAIVLVIVGVAFIFVYKYVLKKLFVSCGVKDEAAA